MGQIRTKMIKNTAVFSASTEMCIVPMWVRFPNLPLELWTQAALSKIGSCVGVPIRTDGITKERLRCSYACVLVHVDTSKELVRSFSIIMPDGGSFEQQVVYESERAKCKLLTHTTEPPTRRSSKPRATKEKASPQPNCHQAETSPQHAHGNEIGSEEVVKAKRKSKKRRGSHKPRSHR